MRIAVLVSGGVDSSLALARLAATGEHRLTAFYLKIWLEDELAHLGACPWEEDLSYARAVCAQFDVPLEVIPLQQAYHDRVVQHAVEELSRGRTPSPDIYCNAQIKFGAFFDNADVADAFDAVASGHYARVGHDGTHYQLLRAPDPVKDQSYFLSRLSQKQLGKLLFPIGDLQKHVVRSEAERLQLAARDRPDSQGICFLGKIRYPEFVRAYLGDRPGDIVDTATGKVLGPHRGVWYHTIGQRKGLGLGGGPWFVVGKDLEADRLYVAHGDTHTRESVFVAEDAHWIGPAPSAGPVQVKLRHGPRLADAALAFEGDTLRVTLAHPDQGIAPGQHVVFYGVGTDVCLGQGVISAVIPANAPAPESQPTPTH